MTNDNQHIPSGYKPSPLGPIPEDWEVKRLGEVCDFLRTNTLSRNQLNDSNGDIQNIHYGDVLIKYPSIIDAQKQSIPFINKEDYKESMTDFIEDGDIVYVPDSGKIVWSEDIKPYIDIYALYRTISFFISFDYKIVAHFGQDVQKRKKNNIKTAFYLYN